MNPHFSTAPFGVGNRITGDRGYILFDLVPCSQRKCPSGGEKGRRFRQNALTQRVGKSVISWM